MYSINIPHKTQTGEINTMPVTVVDNGEYLFYLVIDYFPPKEILKFKKDSLKTGSSLIKEFLICES